jgi:hypothetical protein
MARLRVKTGAEGAFEELVRHVHAAAREHRATAPIVVGRRPRFAMNPLTSSRAGTVAHGDEFV